MTTTAHEQGTTYPARTYTAADFTHAARRCNALHKKHPSWP
jgi:hypothetical protein